MCTSQKRQYLGSVAAFLSGTQKSAGTRGLSRAGQAESAVTILLTAASSAGHTEPILTVGRIPAEAGHGIVAMMPSASN